MNFAADVNNFSVAIIEHDENQESMVTWVYPDLNTSLQKICIKRSLSEGREVPFIFFKFKSEWIYIFTRLTNDAVPSVKSVSFCIVTQAFHPERFSSLLPILVEQYIKASGDPVKVLETVLSVYATGMYSNDAGSFNIMNFADSVAILASTKAMQGIYQSLGMDFIILWNALLLRKRILVVSSNVSNLLSVIRCLPLLAWHRQDWSILRPIIRDEVECMDDLQSSGVYIAGSVDSTMTSKSNDFDIIYLVDSAHVEVLPHAVADIKMCSVHKEVLVLIEETAVSQGGGSSDDITKAIARKTASIISQLRSIVPEGGKLSEGMLQEKVANEATMRWLIRLSAAEGII